MLASSAVMINELKRIWRETAVILFGAPHASAGSGACGAPKCPERERAVSSSGLHRRLCSGGQGVTSQMIIGGGLGEGGTKGKVVYASNNQH